MWVKTAVITNGVLRCVWKWGTYPHSNDHQILGILIVNQWMEQGAHLSGKPIFSCDWNKINYLVWTGNIVGTKKFKVEIKQQTLGMKHSRVEKKTHKKVLKFDQNKWIFCDVSLIHILGHGWGVFVATFWLGNFLDDLNPRAEPVVNPFISNTGSFQFGAGKR